MADYGISLLNIGSQRRFHLDIGICRGHALGEEFHATIGAAENYHHCYHGYQGAGHHEEPIPQCPAQQAFIDFQDPAQDLGHEPAPHRFEEIMVEQVSQPGGPGEQYRR